MEKSRIDGLSISEYKKKIENIGYQDELTDEIHYNMERLKITLEELTNHLDGFDDFEYKEKVIVDELIESLEHDKKEIG